jgi:hypothetical protein
MTWAERRFGWGGPRFFEFGRKSAVRGCDGVVERQYLCTEIDEGAGGGCLERGFDEVENGKASALRLKMEHEKEKKMHETTAEAAEKRKTIQT